MNFAQNLIQLRKQRALSQEELAEILDVSRQAVSKWEAGINMPDIPKLIAIADEFGISLDALVRPSFKGKNKAFYPERRGADGEAYFFTEGAKAGTESSSAAEAVSGTINIVSGGKTLKVGSGSTVYLKNEYEYVSKIKIGNLPLVHIHTGDGARCARGIIAIGNIAFGLVALGGISLGLFSFGGLSIGLLFALGGVAVGAVSLGGLSIGLAAFGGCALGMGAFGGLAAGKVFAAGGAAYGPVSIGENVEAAFRLTEHTSKEEIIRFIEEQLPSVPASILVKLFRFFP